MCKGVIDTFPIFCIIYCILCQFTIKSNIDIGLGNFEIGDSNVSESKKNNWYIFLFTILCISISITITILYFFNNFLISHESAVIPSLIFSILLISCFPQIYSFLIRI